MSSKTSVKTIRFKDVRAGQAGSRRYVLTEAVYEGFLGAFGDVSPIHMDDTFARKRKFKSKVMHGAILNGFVSHFIGVCFPGKYALLQSVNMQYRSPVFLNDTVTLQYKVEHKSEATKTLSLGLRFMRKDSKQVVATGKAQVGVMS